MSEVTSIFSARKPSEHLVQALNMHYYCQEARPFLVGYRKNLRDHPKQYAQKDFSILSAITFGLSATCDEELAYQRPNQIDALNSIMFLINIYGCGQFLKNEPAFLVPEQVVGFIYGIGYHSLNEEGMGLALTVMEEMSRSYPERFQNPTVSQALRETSISNDGNYFPRIQKVIQNAYSAGIK